MINGKWKMINGKCRGPSRPASDRKSLRRALGTSRSEKRVSRLPDAPQALNDQWQMENDKWQMSRAKPARFRSEIAAAGPGHFAVGEASFKASRRATSSK